MLPLNLCYRERLYLQIPLSPVSPRRGALWCLLVVACVRCQQVRLPVWHPDWAVHFGILCWGLCGLAGALELSFPLMPFWGAGLCLPAMGAVQGTC